MTASETLDLGCKAALNEARRLINLNCAFGSVRLANYPLPMAQHIVDQLKSEGYEFEMGGSCNPGLIVRWVPKPPFPDDILHPIW